VQVVIENQVQGHVKQAIRQAARAAAEDGLVSVNAAITRRAKTSTRPEVTVKA
jgi:hypothetical protein